jgi:hypothetical protein
MSEHTEARDELLATGGTLLTQITAAGVDWAQRDNLADCAHELLVSAVMYLRAEIKAELEATEPPATTPAVEWKARKLVEACHRLLVVGGHPATDTDSERQVRDALFECRDALDEAEKRTPPVWEDVNDGWTERIKASHPGRSGDHDAYAIALQLVGNRRSKGTLVALVTFLLHEHTKMQSKAIGICAAVHNANRVGGARAAGVRDAAVEIMRRIGSLPGLRK